MAAFVSVMLFAKKSEFQISIFSVKRILDGRQTGVV
jgi:hypothetical protein